MTVTRPAGTAARPVVRSSRGSTARGNPRSALRYAGTVSSKEESSAMMATQLMEMDALRAARSSRAIVARDNLRSVQQGRPAGMAFWMVESNVMIATFLMEMVAVLAALLSPDFFAPSSLAVHAVPSAETACWWEESSVMTTTRPAGMAALILAQSSQDIPALDSPRSALLVPVETPLSMDLNSVTTATRPAGTAAHQAVQ